MFSLLSRLPGCPWGSTGTRFLQKPQHLLCALRIREKLSEVAGVAISRKVFSAWCIVDWAVQKHVLNGLDGLAAGASYLVWGMLRKEPLRVRPYKGVPCNDAVKCCKCFSGELSFSGPGFARALTLISGSMSRAPS